MKESMPDFIKPSGLELGSREKSPTTKRFSLLSRNIENQLSFFRKNHLQSQGVGRPRPESRPSITDQIEKFRRTELKGRSFAQLVNRSVSHIGSAMIKSRVRERQRSKSSSKRFMKSTQRRSKFKSSIRSFQDVKAKFFGKGKSKAGRDRNPGRKRFNNLNSFSKLSKSKVIKFNLKKYLR